VLAIALKKSLRSDRLYQPLYEANIMQLLLEGRLGAPQVDFEVHTLQSAGTAAVETYKSASLAAVATERHRARAPLPGLPQRADGTGPGSALRASCLARAERAAAGAAVRHRAT